MTTKVYVLLVHWSDTYDDDIQTYAGRSEEEAWAMFLQDGRDSAKGYPDEQEAYASREAFDAAFSADDVYTRVDVIDLPA